MTTASVSALKANLSRYLRHVRRGGEVQILDRGVPVARPMAPRPGDDDVRDLLVGDGLAAKMFLIFTFLPAASPP